MAVQFEEVLHRLSYLRLDLRQIRLTSLLNPRLQHRLNYIKILLMICLLLDQLGVFGVGHEIENKVHQKVILLNDDFRLLMCLRWQFLDALHPLFREIDQDLEAVDVRIIFLLVDNLRHDFFDLIDARFLQAMKLDLFNAL